MRYLRFGLGMFVGGLQFLLFWLILPRSFRFDRRYLVQVLAWSFVRVLVRRMMRRVNRM